MSNKANFFTVTQKCPKFTEFNQIFNCHALNFNKIPKIYVFSAQNLAQIGKNLQMPQARFSLVYIFWKYRYICLRKSIYWEIWLVAFQEKWIFHKSGFSEIWCRPFPEHCFYFNTFLNILRSNYVLMLKFHMGNFQNNPKQCIFILFCPKYVFLDPDSTNIEINLKFLKNSFTTLISLVIRFQRALNHDQGIILSRNIPKKVFSKRYA